MKSNLSALAAGPLFGMGLMLSGMSNPGEVLSFLEWTGVWSPDLIGVLGSAVLVSLVGFQLARRKDKPWFEAEFPALPKKSIDRPLHFGTLPFWPRLGATAPARRLPGWRWATTRCSSFSLPCLPAGLLQHWWARQRNDL